MGRSVEKTGKTIDEARNAALAELGAHEEDTKTEILEEPSKGFFGLIGGRNAKVRVTVIREPVSSKNDFPETPILTESSPTLPDIKDKTNEAEPSPVGGKTSEALDTAEDFLKKICAAMELEVTIRRYSRDGREILNLSGESLGILIGKHGQTLDSLQYLVNLTANRGITENRTRIILDVEEYRERREETLCRLASHIADKVARTRQRVMLEPMNRHERKVIHTALQDDRRVSTYSAGDEPFRKVVIEPYRERRHYRRSDDYRRDDDRHESENKFSQ